MKRLCGLATVIALGTACTNSGLSEPPITDTSPDTTGTTPTTSCEWIGTWNLSQAFCQSFDVTSDWFAIYSETRLVIQEGSAPGECAVSFQWSGNQCTEEEEWTILSSDQDSISIRFGGIVSCSPNACEFWGGEGECLVGDRTQADPMDFELEIFQDGLVRIKGILALGYPSCSPGTNLTTQWSRE